MSTPNERLEAFLKEINKNANSLGKELGNRAVQNLYHVLNGRNGISPELADKVKKLYPWVSWAWLVRGDGSMYERDNTLNSYSSKLLSLYPNKKITEEEVMEVVIPEEGIFAYTMKGNSMMPEYNPVDILGCKVVNKHSVIEYGRPYLIKTQNGVLVRRVMPAENQSTMLLVSTDEKKFPAIALKIEDIEAIAIIHSFIRSH